MTNPSTKIRKRYSADWHKDLVGEKEKNERMETVLNARITLEVLRSLLQKRRDQLETKYDYDSPAWQFKLANDIGRKEELDYLLKLLTPITDPQE